jgi:hypothetical protein
VAAQRPGDWRRAAGRAASSAASQISSSTYPGRMLGRSWGSSTCGTTGIGGTPRARFGWQARAGAPHGFHDCCAPLPMEVVPPHVLPRVGGGPGAAAHLQRGQAGPGSAAGQSARHASRKAARRRPLLRIWQRAMQPGESAALRHASSACGAHQPPPGHLPPQGVPPHARLVAAGRDVVGAAAWWEDGCGLRVDPRLDACRAGWLGPSDSDRQSDGALAGPGDARRRCPRQTHSYLRGRSSDPNTLPGNMWPSSTLCVPHAARSSADGAQPRRGDSAAAEQAAAGGQQTERRGCARWSRGRTPRRTPRAHGVCWRAPCTPGRPGTQGARHPWCCACGGGRACDGSGPASWLRGNCALGLRFARALPGWFCWYRDSRMGPPRLLVYALRESFASEARGAWAQAHME